MSTLTPSPVSNSLRYPSSRRIIAILALTLAATAPAGAAGFFDDFSSPTLDPAWTVVQTWPGGAPRVYGYTDPGNRYSLSANPGFLRYQLDRMTHHDGFLNGYATTYSYHSCCNHDAGLELHRIFSGNSWVFEARGIFYLPYVNGRGFSIRIYFGTGAASAYWVDLRRGADVNQNYVSLRLFEKTGPALGDFSTLENFQPNGSWYYGVSNYPTAPLFFRLERAGGVLTASWSDDGTAWTAAWSHDLGSALDGLDQRVVVTGLSWFSPAGSYADWDYLSLTSSSVPCVDLDGDSYGSPPGPECPGGPEEDCDDANYSVFPGAPELCDGLDNDCDGSIDEGLGVGAACDTGIPGECGPGTLVCGAGGVVACQPLILPGQLGEVCDGLDNDCDGLADEGNPGGGVSCDTGIPGVCAAGTTECSAGALACLSDIGPSAELCDGLDNDCDGVADEDIAPVATSCGVGECAGVGELTCQGGVLVDSCQPGPPSDEVCDALDNDCDGAVDEGFDADGDEIADCFDDCPYDADNDADADAVCGDLDVCAGTVIPEGVPTTRLGVNRFALTDADPEFDTAPPPGGGGGPGLAFTTSDTAGCSCEQIIEALDLGNGHVKFGCSISAMEAWTALVNP